MCFPLPQPVTESNENFLAGQSKTDVITNVAVIKPLLPNDAGGELTACNIANYDPIFGEALSEQLSSVCQSSQAGNMYTETYDPHIIKEKKREGFLVARTKVIHIARVIIIRGCRTVNLRAGGVTTNSCLIDAVSHPLY